MSCVADLKEAVTRKYECRCVGSKSQEFSKDVHVKLDPPSSDFTAPLRSGTAHSLPVTGIHTLTACMKSKPVESEVENSYITTKTLIP